MEALARTVGAVERARRALAATRRLLETVPVANLGQGP
jgi:hypothetical protein